MCGRFTLKTPPDDLRRLFNYPESPNFPPRYNIAPTQPVAVIRAGSAPDTRHFTLMRWGFIPSWAKDAGKFPLIINARSEEAAAKPAFRAAIRRRRCLIPADGFYEWQAPAGAGGRKMPYYIHRPGGGPFAFAGLWECHVDAHGNEIDTVAILTAAANRTLAPLHPRCPVVVGEADFALWLDHRGERVEPVAGLLRSPPDDFFAVHAVSTLVNAVANDNAALIEPAGGVAVGPRALPERAGGDEPEARQLKLF